MIVLKKLQGITNYLYFHVLGEPLVHPRINEFINLAIDNGFNVNITTNGYLIKNIIDSKRIRQLNISLHSFNECNGKTLSKYMSDIFEVEDKLSENTYINYRLWVGSNKKIIELLEEKYKCKINGSMKLKENVFIDFDEEFIWPDLENNLDKQTGKCLGLIDHFGILVDGTIIPCCLDSKGIINLGNIFVDDIDKVLNSKRANLLRENNKMGNRCENLCKHCGFRK